MGVKEWNPHKFCNNDKAKGERRMMGTTKAAQKQAKANLDEKLGLAQPSRELLESLAVECGTLFIILYSNHVVWERRIPEHDLPPQR
jgi:hypothetical protein